MVDQNYLKGGFGAYKTYLAIKQHFKNDKYDFFKYNGEIRATPQSFEKRNDRYFFAKLAKNMSAEEVTNFFVANMITQGTDTWVGDMCGDEAMKEYTSWQRRNMSLLKVFRDEIEDLFQTASERSGELLDFFRVKDNQHPEIVVWLLQGRISVETFIILDRLVGFIDLIDKKLDDPYVWKKIVRKCRKYEPFVKKDERFKTVLNELFREFFK